MDTWFTLLLAAVVGLALLLAIFLMLKKSAVRADQLEGDNRRLTEEASALRDEASNLRDEISALKDRLIELNAAKTQIDSECRHLREKLAEHTAAALEENKKDGIIKTELAPVKQDVGALKKIIDELKTDQAKTLGQLQEQLTQTKEQLEGNRKITETLSLEAHTLSQAMRNTRSAGVWGEQRLRDLLQASSLIPGKEYQLQETIEYGSKRHRPDAVVNIPGGPKIAIDAKAPFAAFMEAIGGQDNHGVSEADAKELFVQHAKAVRAHIDDLGKRSYHEGIKGPSFTVLFLPAEGLLQAAIEADNELLSYAFKRNVALATPVNLWSILQTVAYLCQQQKLTESAQDIIVAGEDLLKHAGILAGHVDSVGRSLKSAVSNYNKVVGSMERNLIRTVRRINSFDQHEIEIREQDFDSVRTFTAAELSAATELLPATISDGGDEPDHDAGSNSDPDNAI